jgi:hypothetical protein
VRRDGGDWEQHGELSMEWPVHPGLNRLEAAAVNAFGRRGRICSAAVEVAAPAA